MALSAEAFLHPQPRSYEAAVKNPSWIPYIRGWAETEDQADEIVLNTSETLQKLNDLGYPVHQAVFMIWKGHSGSPIPGDKGFLAPRLRAELSRLDLRFKTEVGEVKTIDPFGSLLNFGIGFASHRKGSYLLSVSPSVVDYLTKDVAKNFIEATLRGALGVGLEMSEISALVGPSNRLALWGCGAVARSGGFATSAERPLGSDKLQIGTAMCQEQIGTMVRIYRDQEYEPCFQMVPSSSQGLYRRPKASLGQRLHDVVAENLPAHQNYRLAREDSSLDELESSIFH